MKNRAAQSEHRATKSLDVAYKRMSEATKRKLFLPVINAATATPEVKLLIKMAAQLMGRRAKGVPKRITPKDRARRRRQMEKINEARKSQTR